MAAQDDNYYESREFQIELTLDGFDDWVLEEERCPYCGRILDYGECHECGYRTE